ncbi:hypothetical protein GGR51DRAFT_577894 [Nemania sp. FL0031]|nr:hypothetical protein GGR51DRAFT_577894 [Nemania sp. FL0031]
MSIFTTDGVTDGIIDIPPPPALLNKCILLGVDPVTGTRPIFARFWDAGQQIPVGRLRMHGSALGKKAYIRSVTYKANARTHFIPPIAMYRDGALEHVKVKLYDVASSDAQSSLRFSFPTTAPDNVAIWQGSGPCHVSDHLITKLPLTQALSLPKTTSIQWDISGLIPPHPHQGHGYDMVPAFNLEKPPSDVLRMVRQCTESIGHHQMEVKELFYYGVWWAHYKLNKQDHRIFGKEYSTNASFKHFALSMRDIMRRVEDEGSAWFPHLGKAADSRTELAVLSRGDEEFEHLGTVIREHFREYTFPRTGYLVPGDLQNCRNEVFSDLDNHPLFGRNSPGSHAASVKHAVQALKGVLVAGPAPDIDTSPRRPNLCTADVNQWRQRMASLDAPVQPIQPTQASLDAPVQPTQPTQASLDAPVRPIMPHQRGLLPRPVMPSSDGPLARQTIPRQAISLLASSDARPRPRIRTHPVPTQVSSDAHDRRTAEFLLETERMERADPGAPGTRRPPGVTRSARRRANQNRRDDVESEDSNDEDIPRVSGTTRNRDAARVISEDMRNLMREVEAQQHEGDRWWNRYQYEPQEWERQLIAAQPPPLIPTNEAELWETYQEPYWTAGEPAPLREPRQGNTVTKIITSDDVKSKAAFCVICQETQEEGTEALAGECGHFYCPDCINTWLAYNHTCPLCNHAIAEPLRADED